MVTVLTLLSILHMYTYSPGGEGTGGCGYIQYVCEGAEGNTVLSLHHSSLGEKKTSSCFYVLVVVSILCFLSLTNVLQYMYNIWQYK